MNAELYGPGAQHPPLASAGAPYSVVEQADFFVLEFRSPFEPQGGGYVKSFRVDRRTGQVTRETWILGR